MVSGTIRWGQQTAMTAGSEKRRQVTVDVSDMVGEAERMKQ